MLLRVITFCTNLVAHLASGNVFRYINSERYFHADVFVIKPSPERRMFLEENYKWKFTHKLVAELPTPAYQSSLLDLTLTWVIKETEFGLGDLGPPLWFFKRRWSLPNHVPQKLSNRLRASDGRETLTLLLTDVFQVSFGPRRYWDEELQYHLFWGDWLLHITSFRQVTLITQHLVILAFTHENPDIFRPTDYREGLLMAPFTIFIPQVAMSSVFIVKQSWMPCLHCENLQRSYLNEEYFLGEFNTTLYSGIKNGFGQESGRLAFSADGVPGLDFPAEIHCDDPWKILYRVYDKTGKDPCREARALTTKIIAEALNLTTSCCGKPVPRYKYEYNDVQLNYIFITQLLVLISPEVHRMILWDYSKYVFKYCSNGSSYDVLNIFEILGKPFDMYTWICLLVGIVSLFVYFKQERGSNGRPASFQNICMELAKLLLQRSIQRKNQVRVLALFVFFFTEFFYLGSVTERIIAPPARHIMETLSEALLNEFKIDADETFYHGFEAIKAELEKEDFGESFAKSGYIYNPKFFKTAEDEPTFIKYLLPSSWYSYEGKSHLGSFHSKNGQICDYIHRAYGNRTIMIKVYSAFKERSGRLLHLILYDSGIRLFWVRLASFQSRAFRVKELRGIRNVVVLSFDDDRFQAVLKFLSIGLFMSIIIWMLEKAQSLKHAYSYVTSWCFTRNARVNTIPNRTCWNHSWKLPRYVFILRLVLQCWNPINLSHFLPIVPVLRPF